MSTLDVKEESFYMNPCTGSVALGREWMKDFEESDQSIEDWMGEADLVEVDFVDGEWQEVNY